MKITALENIGMSYNEVPLNDRQTREQLAASITNNIYRLLNNFCGTVMVDKEYGILEPYWRLEANNLQFITDKIRQYEKRLLSFDVRLEDGDKYQLMVIKSISNCLEENFAFDMTFEIHYRFGLIYFVVKK